MQIYLDHSATTPPLPEVIHRIHTTLEKQWGNPSSIHDWGQHASEVLEEARLQVAQLIQADSQTLIFTSGGTEADNLALQGIAQTYGQPQHIIISSVEHSAVAETALALEQQGWDVSRLPVDRWGRVDPEILRQTLRPNTVLVSVIYGQNEVGTLQPIPKLAQVCREAGVLFHTDAVQVAGHLPLAVEELGVDLLSLSGHKFHGSQGAGVLYVRSGVNLKPLQRGGGQEQTLRSGTQAVATIAGLGIAAQLAQRRLPQESQRLADLRNRLQTKLAAYPYLHPTGDPQHRLPHHLSFCVDHPQGQPVNGKTIVRQMNLAGIAISSGSACSSGKTLPNPILKAMGYDDRLAISSLRLSLGLHTTQADVDWVAQVLPQVVERVMT